MMERRRDGERQEGRKKRKGKKEPKFILDLVFEVWIYISKYCVFFHFNKNQPENF